MVLAVGPMLSLSATGNFGKSLNFFYGPNGAVIRRLKRSFTPPGQIWYVNQIAFNAASVRWASFSRVQQNAWALFFGSMCDIPRDLFMGKQIESWNMHPDYDLSWPESHVPDFPWPPGRCYINTDVYTVSFSLEFSGEKQSQWKIPGFRWYSSESQASLVNPVFIGETYTPRLTIKEAAMPSSYCWAAAIRSNGIIDPAKFVAVFA